MSQYIDKMCADFSPKMHKKRLAGAYSAPQNSCQYLKGTDMDKRRERGETGERTGKEGTDESKEGGNGGEEGGNGDKEGRQRGDGKSRSHGHF